MDSTLEHSSVRGKEKKRYRYENMKTLHEKFRSLSLTEPYLKPGGGPTGTNGSSPTLDF